MKSDDDQEVARVVHADDDVDLEGKPLAVVLLGHPLRKPVHAQAVAEPLLRLASQLHRLVGSGIGAGTDREARQDRLARQRAECAALGDFDRRGQRLRHVGEQDRHFGAGLETVIGRQLLAVGLGDQPPAGDAEQRVVGLIIVSGREIRLVGRDQRQPLGIRQIDQLALDAAFPLDAMALQFDIEAVAEQARQAFAARRRQRFLAGLDRQRDRPIRAAGERDQVLGIFLEPLELDVRRLVDRGLQEGARIEPHQAAITTFARRQQHDPRRRGRLRAARARVMVAEIDREFAAGDRLDAVARHLVGELQRPEHVVGVGQSQRRLAVGFRKFAELGDLDRALQQRIGGMDVKMDKAGVGHGDVGVPLPGSAGRPSQGILSDILAPRPTRPDNGGVSHPKSPRKRRSRPALSGRHPAFPQGRPRPRNQSWGMSCAQTAIIPTNSVIDASAAASSTKTFNITASRSPRT